MEHILKLLRREQEDERGFPRHERLTPFQVKMLQARERMLSFVLLSPLWVAVPAFVLFCTGILMLAWNKQPRAVAIFTSVAVFICLILFAGFFVQHRRKHVIRKLYLGRPSF